MALFRSPHKGFVQNVRKSVPERHPATGEIIGLKQRPLRAEFGIFGAEQPFTNPETGETTMVADIRGGFFDTETAAEANGWTPEEHDAVVQTLRYQCTKVPGMIQEVLPVHVTAPLPWATYDSQTAEDAVMVAQATGLVPEALRYERENLRRAAVTEPLEDALAQLSAEEQARAETQEQVPAEMLLAARSHGVTVGKAPETTDGGIVRGTPGFTEKPSPTIAL